METTKPEGYYDGVRKDFLPFIGDIKGKKFLEIGCGSGAMGRFLKTEGAALVYGVEIVPEEARKAEPNYDRLFNDNIETLSLPSPLLYFDHILFGDVLEHLYDPWAVLRKLKPFLTDQGSVIASIPNIRAHWVIGRILCGLFGYDSNGILDKTHIRFFTYHDMIQMFIESGYQIGAVSANPYPEIQQKLDTWIKEGSREKLEEAIRILSGKTIKLTESDLVEFFVEQFLIQAKKAV